MNSQKLLTLFALCLVAPVVASAATIKAGADSSGGGKSVVCREGGRADGKILSIEMLDLYESRALYGLEPMEELGSVEAYLAFISEKLKPATEIGTELARDIGQLHGKLRILPPGTRIEPVDDASPIVLPEGCRLEQAAVWLDPALVVVDREQWEAMDSRNRAALTAHEVIYNSDRWQGHKNSRHTRKVVAHLFSRFQFSGVYDGVPSRDYRACYAAKGDVEPLSFFLYADSNGALVAHIRRYLGDFVYGRVAHTFSDVRFDEFGKGNRDVLQVIRSDFESEIPFFLLWDESKPEASRAELVIFYPGRNEIFPVVCRHWE